MTGSPFHRTASTVRAVSFEAAALAGHLLLYPSGVPQEPWPLHRPTCDHLPAEPPDAPPRTQLDEPPDAPPRTRLDEDPDAQPAALLGATAAIPAGCPPPAGAAGPTGHAPVLLLHGLADNRSVFALLRRSLRRGGWEHVHALNYSPLTMDVRAAAVLLGRHVRHTRRIYGDERVALIGHSLGGLIARYYVQRLGGDEHVHTVITLGTPHQGTHAARLPSLLPIMRQLRPGSELLAELAAPAPDLRTRFVAIWGDLDQLVLPQRNARLEHPDLDARNVLVPGVGHLTLPMHCHCATAVREALAARLSTPSAPSAEAHRLTA